MIYMQISQENIYQKRLSVISNLFTGLGEEDSIETHGHLLETCDKWIALITIHDSNDVLLHRSIQHLHTNRKNTRDELLERMPSRFHKSNLSAQVISNVASSATYLVLIGLILLVAVNQTTSLKHVNYMQLSGSGLNETSVSFNEMMEEQRSTSNTVDESPIVQIKSDTLFKGIRLKSFRNARKEGNVIAFLGIRYANPPVKRLRFMPPTDYHYAPDLIHSAQRFGPICWQRWPIDYQALKTSVGLSKEDDSVEKWLLLTKTVMPELSFSRRRHLFKQLASMEQSEDCLNLNIYTPEKAFLSRNNNAFRPLPVLVMIHGESFDYGSGSTLNPTKFVRENRIIVMTFNYRLNILGFPPKLAGPSRSNLGLLDQVAALLWIKDNIRAFGGAPNNITLMGSKEGAILVNLLMLSPIAKGLFQRAVMEDGSGLTPLVVNNMNTSPVWAKNQPAMQHVRLLGQLVNCFPKKRPTLNLSATAASENAQASPPEVGAFDEPRTNLALLECLGQLPIEQLLTQIPINLLQPGMRLDSLPMIHQRWLQVTSTRERLEEISMTTDINGTQLVPINSDLLHQLRNRATLLQLERPDGSEPDELFSAIYLQPSMSTMFAPSMDGIIVTGDELLASTSKNSSLGQKDLLIGVTKPILADLQVNQDVNVRHNHLSRDISMALPDWVPTHLQNTGISNEQALNLVNKFVRIHYRWHNQEIANSIVAHYLNQANLYVNAFKSNDVSQSLSGEQMLLRALGEAIQDATVNVPILKTTLIHSMKQVELLSDMFSNKCFEELSQLPTDGRNLAKIDFLNKYQTFIEASFDGQSLVLNKPQSRTIKTTYLYQIDTQLWIRHIQLQIENLTKFRDLGWQAIRSKLIHLVNRLMKEDLQTQISLGCIFHDNDSIQEKHDLYSSFNNWLCSRLGSILNNFANTNEDKSEITDYKGTNKFSEELDSFSTRCYEELDLSNPLVDHDLTLVNPATLLDTSLAATCRSELVSLVLEYLQESQSSGHDWKPFEPITQLVATIPAPNRNLVQMNRLSNNQDHKVSIISRISYWTYNIPTFNCSKTQVIQPNLISSGSRGWNYSTLLNLNVIFSCQTGPHTYLEVLKRISTNIKQHVTTMLEQLDIKRKSEMALQSKVASSSSVMNLTDIGSQQVSDQANQLLIDTQASVSPPILTSSTLNDDETTKAVYSKTKYAGFILLICAFLLVVSLVSASKAIKKQRKRVVRTSKSSGEALNDTKLALTDLNSTTVQDSSPEKINNLTLLGSSGHQQEMVQDNSETALHIQPCFFDEQQEILSELSHIHPRQLIVDPLSKSLVVYDNNASLCSSMASEQSKSVRWSVDQDSEMSHQHARTIFNSMQEPEKLHELHMFSGYHTSGDNSQQKIQNGGIQNNYEANSSSLKKRVKISDPASTMIRYKSQRYRQRNPSMTQVGDMMYCQMHAEGLPNQQQIYTQHGISSDQIHIWAVEDGSEKYSQVPTGFYSDAIPVYQGEQLVTYGPNMVTGVEEHSTHGHT